MCFNLVLGAKVGQWGGKEKERARGAEKEAKTRGEIGQKEAKNGNGVPIGVPIGVPVLGCQLGCQF